MERTTIDRRSLILKELRGFRDNVSDEIPVKMLRGDMPRKDICFKVRKNWFNGVVGALAELVDKDLAPVGLEQEIRNFLEHFTSLEFQLQELVTPEDIAKANEMITKVLGDEMTLTD